MKGMRRSLLGLLLVLAGAEGFIWPIDNTYSVGQSKFTFSELYMYSKDDAPMGMTFVDRPEVLGPPTAFVSCFPLSTVHLRSPSLLPQ